MNKFGHFLRRHSGRRDSQTQQVCGKGTGMLVVRVRSCTSFDHEVVGATDAQVDRPCALSLHGVFAEELA